MKLSYSNNIIFIADFFLEHVLGGGELCNNILIENLQKKGFKVSQVLSNQVKIDFLQENKDKYFIIGNFLGLSEEVKSYLGNNCRYIIYEHDHKYLKSRNPSVYKNNLAPKSELQNVDFYRKAVAVLCQTKLHASIVKANLGFNNIVNLGGNLWGSEILDYIEELSSNPKIKEYAILDSANPIKNKIDAEEFCVMNNHKYDLIKDNDYLSFLDKLSVYKGFVFFPTSVETCSRIIVEARMLGLKIFTNNNIGAASEDWFKLRGKELISFMRKKETQITEQVIDILLNKEKSHILDLTVILNLYRRPQNLAKQIEAIKNQTLEPKEIWVWRNYHEDSDSFDLNSLDVDRWIDSNYNWKYFGRFTLGLMARTKYVAFFDDDTIPGSEWFQNCMDTMNKEEAILGGIGIELNDQMYYGNHVRHGWACPNEEAVEVDLVGHAWFLKKEWLKYMWQSEPLSLENGEDIHLSFAAQKYGGIKTVVPPHPANSLEKHSSLFGVALGVDSVASSHPSRHSQFYRIRDEVMRHCISNGWVTVNAKDKKSR